MPRRAALEALLSKTAGRPGPAPNLLDHAGTCARFRWASARALLTGLPNGGLNIAFEAVDRHLERRGDTVALRFLGQAGARRDLHYRELARLTSRFAGVLDRLGLRRGEVVFSLAGRVPELYIAALGTLKAGAVFSPLSPALGPEAIFGRLSLGKGKVLVTTLALYEGKVSALRSRLPDLAQVLLVRTLQEAQSPLPEGTLDFEQALAAESDRRPVTATRPDSPAFLHFTSGTAGRPKGVVHLHRAVVQHHLTALDALDLHEDDVFWCTAAPGWVTATSDGIIGPLTHGATLLIDDAEADAERWYRQLEQERVTVWSTTPAAVRMLIRAGDALPGQFDLSRLRLASSVGEPLDPGAVEWSAKVLGLPLHDRWCQSEAGGTMIANFRALPVRPGSMGKPLPGVKADIVARRPDGSVAPVPVGTVGELALQPGWPSMFAAYLGEEERYRSCFCGDWYLSGDLARVDADGYFWFVGRSDDVIKSSGHLIGSFEVEAALLEHPAVAEAAAIGRPDPTLGALVKAFVTLNPGFVNSEALRQQLLTHARRRLGPAVAPRAVAVIPALPHTQSGNLMRRLLRAQELGLPEGDTSTLEGSA